jgi:hypothetical protein
VLRRVLVQEGGAVCRGVDDDVDARERRGRLGEQALDVEVVGEVRAQGDDRAFRGEDLSDRRLGGGLMLEVDHHDRPAPAASPRATSRPAPTEPPVTTATARRESLVGTITSPTVGLIGCRTVLRRDAERAVAAPGAARGA